MDQNKFIEELKKINVTITQKQMDQLNKYYELLKEWNEKINLTAITEYDQVLLKHFYDSATMNKVTDLTKVNTLCDIGTGAGFPGMVLKILFPNLKVTLVDALQKRVKFLNEIISQLELNDIEVYHARAEEYSRNHREKYDIVTARAVARLNIIMEYTIPMVKLNGYFIPLKGNISEEINSSNDAFEKLSCQLENVLEFQLPIEKSNRTILKIKKTKPTSLKYPRSYAEIKKRPL